MSEVAPTASSLFDLLQQSGSPPVYAGTTQLNGVLARQFTILPTSAALSSTVFTYYDSVATHYPLRITVAGTSITTTIFDIVSFAPAEAIPFGTFRWFGPLPGDSNSNATGAVPPLYP